MAISQPLDAETSKRRWGVAQRLEFIEFRAYWDGGLNRSDIRDHFGVSAPQASSDLAAYIALAPGNLIYNARAKRYFASDDFKVRLIEPSADRYLGELAARRSGILSAIEAWAGVSPPFEVVPVPSRAVDVEALRKLIATIKSASSLEIYYQSMNVDRPDPEWRRVTPHAFASDGLRWHVRGYCHKDAKFKDFVLPRIRQIRNIGVAGALPIEDADWNTVVQVHLIPNPLLSQGQRKAVAADYNMRGGCLDLGVRRALLYYVKKRLRLDVPSDRPGETPVVVSNPAAFESALHAARGERVAGLSLV
jgi:hypothetical protein